MGVAVEAQSCEGLRALGVPAGAGGRVMVPRGERPAAHDGPLMLVTVPAFDPGSACSLDRLVVSHVTTAAAVTWYYTGLPSPWLEATAGTPRAAPARAAPTVPEMSMNWPTFWPKLTPATTTSGLMWRVSKA